jgi:hypothetical protein
MTTPTKKVHFNNDGSGNIVFTLHIIERSTRYEICGDTSAAARGHASKDPDYGTIAYMRAQRLRCFKQRFLQNKRKKTLLTIFQALKPKTHCIKCTRAYSIHSLTPVERIFFANLPWCGKCQRRISGIWTFPRTGGIYIN